tara:strand:- start:44 stop:505 length:462 start_codon:yes stop_codon:yes gene_type:complete
MGDSIEDLITGLAPLFGGDRAKAAKELDNMREAYRKQLQEVQSTQTVPAPALNIDERTQLEDLNINTQGRLDDLNLKKEVDFEESGIPRARFDRKLEGMRTKGDIAVQLQQLPAETLLKLQQGQIDMLDRVNRQKNTANMVNNILKGVALLGL